MFGNILSAVGSIASGLFSSSSAQDQMDFQERMSNTSYQRAVKDMRKAGLNPILAAKLGGASSPAGAMANIPDLGATWNSAFQADTNRMGTEAEIALKEEQEKKIDQEINNLQAQHALTEAQTNQAKLALTQTMAEIDRIKADTGLKNALQAVPSLVADVVTAVRRLGDIANAEQMKKAMEEFATIEVQKNTDDKPWYHFGIEWNKERVLK